MNAPLNIRILDNREDDCTEVYIDIDVPGCCGMRLTWKCDTSVERLALRELLRDRLRQSIHRLTSEAYHQGYKDGRGKRRKKTNFTASMNENLPLAW